MLILTIGMSDRGVVTYQADNPHVEVMGEFLTRDVSTMTDVMRDFLSGEDSTITLDACEITKTNGVIHIKHNANHMLPEVTLPVERIADLVDLWEDFLEHRRPVQWLMFQPEEFGITLENDELAGLFEELKAAAKEAVKRAEKNIETSED